jgi:hypothetical protein
VTLIDRRYLSYGVMMAATSTNLTLEEGPLIRLLASYVESR